MTQLERLSKPLHKRFIHTKPGGQGGSYVSHDVITQVLLAVCGPYDFMVREIIRGNCIYKGEILENVIVGVVAELQVTIDGRLTRIQEIGDVGEPGNWKHDGQRLKDATSDAIKRCAMRLGLGLHLWSQEEYVLYDQLTQRSATDSDSG